MADPGEDHRHAQSVSGLYDQFVAIRAAGLDHRTGSRFHRRFEPVAKGKASVGRSNGLCLRSCLKRCDVYRIYTTHLTCPNSCNTVCVCK